MVVIKSLTEGFKFAISLKRIIPYFILDLVVFSLIMSFFGRIMDIALGSIGFFGFFAYLGIYVIAFIIIGLIGIWVNAAMIDQAKYPRKKPLLKSFEYSTSKFLTMIATVILYAVIAVIVSLPPYIGGLLGFLYSLVFFYIYQAIIIDGKSVIDSFKQSWNVFKRYPLETFVTWLLVMIICLIIIGIFLTPIIFYLIGSLIGSLKTLETTNATITREIIRTKIMPMIISVIYTPYFVPYLIIACIGFSFQTLFFIGTQSRLYINLKKGKLSSEE